MRALRVACLALVFNGCRAQEEISSSASTSSAARDDDTVVATVMGRSVTRDELGASPVGALRSAILSRLLGELREERRLAATSDEIEEFIGFIRSDADGRDDGAIQKVAENFILTWKTSKLIYEMYGGTVISQQLNPLEPVGGYLAFLRERERSGAFVIHDSELAAGFWDYFTRDHGHRVVAPGKVNYDAPWWAKK